MTFRWVRRTAHGPDDGEAGFTVVEVIVALTIIAVVATSAAVFMVRSMSSSKGMQDRQAASTAARQVMEEVRSVPGIITGSGAAALSQLVKGRSRSDVSSAWTAAAAQGLDVSNTYTGSGTTSHDAATYELNTGPSVNPVVPLSGTKTVSGVDFSYTTLIGTCVRPRGTADCARHTTGDQLFRVIVLVSWPDVARTCTAGRCAYSLSTLVDPSEDPTFNTLRKPYAYDDPGAGNPAIMAVSGDRISIPVLGNDQGYWPLNGATSIGTHPSNGVADPDPSSNQVFYTPSPSFSGIDKFSYLAHDTSGVPTNLAEVTVTVRPKAMPDTLTSTTRTTVLNVIGNDRGSLVSGASVQLVGTAQDCSVTAVGGTQFSVTVPNSFPVKQCRFEYTVRDSGGRTSDPAQVTLTVTPPSAPVAYTVQLKGVAGQQMSVDLTPSIAPSGLTVSTSTNGVVVNGNTLTFTPSSVGTLVIPYTVTDTWGRTATSQVEVTVNKPAVNFVVRNLSGEMRRLRTLTIRPSDYVVTGEGPFTVLSVSRSNGLVGVSHNGDEVSVSSGWSTGSVRVTFNVRDEASGQEKQVNVDVRVNW